MVTHEFPYTNLHDLNIDWILQVVKDFQSKYTDFGQTVEDSLQAIEDAKDESLETLQNALSASVTTIENAKINAINDLNTEKASILDVMSQTLQTAITAVETAQENAVADVGAEKDLGLAALQAQESTSLSSITTAYNQSIARLQDLIATFPLDDAQIIGQLQVINSILNGTDALTVQWQQGIYAYVEQDQRTELYNSPNTVTSLVQAGCASRKLHVQANTPGHLITYIYYWTGDWETTTAISTPINATETTFIFPNNATYFTVLLGTNPNMTTPINLADVTATAEWIIAGFVQRTEFEELKSATPSIINKFYTLIQNGTNYDTLTTPGTYICASATAAQTMTNAPSPLAHKMYTITTSGPTRLFQFAMSNSASAQMYKRYYNGSTWTAWKELAIVTPPTSHKILVLGDSYSEQSRWLTSLQSLISVTSLVNIAVSNATVKDRFQNRTQYPYTSRPNKDVTSGNLNTFMCQIEKLKRLMAGTDLDSGEQQIYANASDYPDIIIIEGGQNDAYDADSVVDSYPDQFMTSVSNVYIAKNSDDAGSPTLGSMYIKTPAESVNRTCFAGAYRALVEELQELFPNAIILATSRTLLGYWNSENRFPRVSKIKEQQELCCNMCGIKFINWQNGSQVNTIRNYPKGSGTQNDPYLWGEVSGTWAEHDTYDLLHPTTLGAQKYAKIVAREIKMLDL